MKLRRRNFNRLDAFQIVNERRPARSRSGNRQIKNHALIWGLMRVGGGASRDRTDDPLLAKQVLSQLSYGP